MWEKIVQMISGKDCELRERMLRTIIMVGGLATIVVIIEILVVMEVNYVLIPFLILLLLVMGVTLFITFKYRKYNFASTLLGLVIVVMVMPLIFCMNGGINSGASVWLALGILYIFVMFTGKKMLFFMMLCFVVYGGTYWMAYYYPELITPMQSKAAIYTDALFSVFAVGIIGGIILKSHMKVFEEEHELNIEQKAELENRRDSQNTFFANMSHEIRTPINAILV